MDTGTTAGRVAAPRDLALAEARSWLGTPFAINQCLKGAGVDCCRFIAASYRAADISLPPPLEFERFPVQWGLHARDERLLAILGSFLHPVDIPLPADVAVFRVGRAFSHVGIITAWPEVIHSSAFHARSRVEIANALQWPLSGREVCFFSPF